MVKLKYCPECGSLQIQKLAFSQEKCGSCGRSGEMNEGSPDEINAVKQRLRKRPVVDALKELRPVNEAEKKYVQAGSIARHYMPKPGTIDDIGL